MLGVPFLSTVFTRRASSGGHLTRAQIAELILAPTGVVDLLKYSDSRQYAKELLMQYSLPTLQWSGVRCHSTQAFPRTGFSADVGVQDWDAFPPSVLPGGEATYAPGVRIEATFDGVATATGRDIDTRLFSAILLASGHVEKQPFLDRILAAPGGTAITLKLPLYHHANGTTAPDMRMWARGPFSQVDAPGGDGLVSAVFSDTATGGPYSRIDLDMTGYTEWSNIDSFGNLEVNVICEQGVAGVNGQTLAIPQRPWLEIDLPGLILHPYDRSGREWAWYQNANYAALATDYYPLLGDGRPQVLWMDLGYNNWSGDSDVATIATRIKSIIDAHRAAHPLLPILLSNAYPAGPSGPNPESPGVRPPFADAILAVEAEYEGVLALDTYGLSPNYVDAPASHFPPTDDVHRTDEGYTWWCQNAFLAALQAV